MYKRIFVRAEWDEETNVRIATSDETPGLATEEDTIKSLIGKIRIMISKLLNANMIEKEYEIHSKY